MDVLYIPQLDEIGSGGEGEGGGGVAARYRLLRRVPEDGTVNLTDRAVTRVEIATDGGPLKLVVPPEVKGSVRDFFVRLVITSDEIPEVTFACNAHFLLHHHKINCQRLEGTTNRPDKNIGFNTI